MVIKNRDRVDEAVNEPPALVQLGHIQGSETANPVNNILAGQHGVLHFLLDDLHFNILFSVLQLVKPLLGGGVYNPHLDRLSTFLGKIIRNLSLNRWEQNNSEKRGGGQVLLALDELSEYIPAAENVEQTVDNLVLVELFNRFLASQSKSRRKIFMQRYWYMSSVKEIAAGYGITEGQVKMSLLRTRKALKKFLEEEGIGL